MLNLNSLKNIYTNSPLWLKKLYASIPYDIRNGTEYRRWKKFLEKELNSEEYQLLKLKETLLYAYENTDYYKKVFDEIQSSPYEINSPKELESFPVIDKSIVRQNFEALQAKRFSKDKIFYVTTGGSTGEPMKFLQSKNVWSKEVAFINNYFRSLGYLPHLKKASFRGGEFNNLPKNVFWKINPINNEIHFSPFHLNEKSIYYYVEALNRYKIQFFHTYPSGVISLIGLMKEHKLKINHQIKAIFLISENFTVEDIQYIKNFFNCQVSSFYGHSERLIFAPLALSKYNSYTLDFRYGFTELINSDNKTIVDNNIKGELVGTSFDNFAMPLIRYKTGDFTSFENYKNRTIYLIKGRWESEYLAGRDGLQLTLTALNMHSDIFKNCINFQFLQREVGKVTLLIVPTHSFNRSDEEAILKSLNSKAGHAIDFTIKRVESALHTERGKMKKLIKEI